MRPNLVVRGIDALLTMDPACGKGRLGRIERAAVAVTGDRIAWVGPDADAPASDEVIDGSGCIGLPGLVDCHTHAVWAGSRADEFERRLAGATYTEILEQGGGIRSTVRATRAASYETLVGSAVERMREALASGVTTMEVKSGYGLDVATETAILRAAREAGGRIGMRVFGTFLGAHVVPAEFALDRAAYVRQILEEQLPAVRPFAHFIDVYVDRGAFTLDEGRAILAAGIRLGLRPRIHAEQVEFTGAAAMAAGLGALSADHLERIDDVGIAALAAAQTVAVLLPGAMLFLRDQPPPVARLRAAGVPMAVATDLNPGTSPVHDLWTAATLACLTMGLTVEEALLGITRTASQALGCSDLGVLRPGCRADLVLVKPPAGEPATPGVLLQHLGGRKASFVLSEGAIRLDLERRGSRP